LRELAKRSDVSHSYISQLEKGNKKNPKPIVLRSLANALGVPYAKLLALAGMEPDASDYFIDFDDVTHTVISVKLPNKEVTMFDGGWENIRMFTEDELLDRLFDLKHYLNMDIELKYDGKTLTDEQKEKISSVLKAIL